MNKLTENKNYVWSFPLLAGILTIIGLLSPSSAFEDIEINWMWGLRYFNLLPIDEGFNWIFELVPNDFAPIIFICKIIPFIVLLCISILSIFLSIKLRREGAFQRSEKKWLICGIFFIVLGIIYLVEIEVLMRFYYDEYFGLDISFWENHTPGFAVIAPFVSGIVVLIGFYLNKYIFPKKKDMIIRVRKLYRNIIFSFLIGFSILFIGVSISFIMFKSMPGDPVVSYLSAYGISMPSQEQYDAMEKALGLDLHIVLQFFKFIGDFFIGNWKISLSVSARTKVTELAILSASRMIALFVLPLIIGLGTGILFGKFTYRFRGRWLDKLIQVFVILGISIPIYFLGMVCQFFFYFKLPLFFSWGNYVIPMYIMTLFTFALITWQTRSYMINKQYERSLTLNTIKIANTFGLLFMSYLLLDITFGLNGLGDYLVHSLQLYDPYLLAGILIALVITLILVIMISNLIFSYNIFRKQEIVSTDLYKEIDDVSSQNLNTDNKYEEKITHYLLRRIKSPYTIIGVVLIAFFIFLSIFPQSLTEISFEDAFDPLAGSWSPPSSDHPLGQTTLGWDVLTWVIYGIRTSMVVGFGAVIIGMIIGGHFGIFTGILKRKTYKYVMGFMILFFIFPGLVFVMLILAIYGVSFLLSLIMIGIFLIPNFTRVVANAISEGISIKRIIKQVLSHIPLNFAIAIMIFEALGFLGFGDISMIELGKSINSARINLYDAPWATLWPGLAIFGLVLSFLVLHVGLQGYDPNLRMLKEIELE